VMEITDFKLGLATLRGFIMRIETSISLWILFALIQKAKLGLILYSLSWDYSRSLGLSEAIVFRILGVFIDSMNMGGLWYSVPYVYVKIHWSVCMWCN
jgi:hypothetical protein